MKFSLAVVASMTLAVATSYAAEGPEVRFEKQDPLDETLAREIWFMAKVGELSSEQREALASQARESLDGWRARIQSPLGTSMRRELKPILRSVSPVASTKFEAEFQRLYERRKRAAARVQVAELDEALSLSVEQRRKLYELLTAGGRGVAWSPDPGVESHTLLRWPEKKIVAAGALGEFFITDDQMRTFLYPWQLIRFRTFRSDVSGSRRVYTITHRIAAEPGLFPDGPDVRPARDASAPAEVRLTFNQEAWILGHLDNLVKHVADDAGLDDQQRERLWLAGKLDIQRWCEAGAPGAEDFPVSIYSDRPKAIEGKPPVRIEIFDAPESAFQKFTRGLQGDRKQKLDTAEDERHRFRRQALVEALVVGFERSSALTAAQCAVLEKTLSDSLEHCPPTSRWRSECLKTIAALPGDDLEPFFADEQWPGAVRQLKQLRMLGR